MSNTKRLVAMVVGLCSGAALVLGTTACSSYPHFAPDPAETEPTADQNPRPPPSPPLPAAVSCQQNVPCELPSLTVYAESPGVTIKVLGVGSGTPRGYAPAPGLPVFQIGTAGKPLGSPLKAVLDLQGLRVEPKLVALFDEGAGAGVVPVEFVQGSAVLLMERGGILRLAHLAPEVPRGCKEGQLSGGDFDVSSLGKLSGVTHIKGNLHLTGPLPSELKQLSCLVEVTGDLTIRQTEGLTSLGGLDALAIVGGALEIGSNADLVRLDLPGLKARIRGLSVASNAKLEKIIIPQLTEIQGNLSISHNGTPKSALELDLSSLVIVAGHVELSSNPGWERAAGFPSLREISGHFTILDNQTLTDLTGFHTLRSVGESLAIGECPNLIWASGLAGLVSIGGSIDVHDCPRLRALDLSQVPQVIGALSISHNGANAAELRLKLSSLESVEGDLTLDYNRGWTSEDGLPALSTIGGSCKIANNDDLVRLQGFDALESIGGELSVTNNEQLAVMRSFPSLTSVARGIAIQSNPALAEVNLDRLEEINGPLVFAYNGTSSAELQLDLSRVAIIWGRADFIYNGSWRLAGGLSRLRKVAGSLSFFHDSELNQISLPLLEAIEGTLDISNDPQLTFVAFDGLKTISGDVNLHSQPQLAIANFSVLDEVAGSVNLSNVGTDGPAWSATFPQLARVGAALTMSNNRNWQLTDTLPVLQVVEGSVTLTKNGELVSVELPRLARIGGSLAISGNPSLATLSGLRELQHLGGDLTVSDNPLLPGCQAETLIEALRELAWRNTGNISGNASEACSQ